VIILSVCVVWCWSRTRRGKEQQERLFVCFFLFFSFSLLAFWGMGTMSLKTFWDIVLGNPETDSRLLDVLWDPAFDVNMRLETFEGSTMLHQACSVRNVPTIRALLRHPQIDVNATNTRGATPCHLVCTSLSPLATSLLLCDVRVDVNHPDQRGRTPFWLAAANGHLDALKLMIALRPDLDTSPRALHPTGAVLTPVEAAAKCWKFQEAPVNPAVELIMNLAAHPLNTRYTTIMELGMHHMLPPALFCLVVLVSDGFLVVRDTERDGNRKGDGGGNEEEDFRRFFRLAARLPLELQMLLSHCAYSSARQLVRSKDLEGALRSLLLAMAREKEHQQPTD